MKAKYGIMLQQNRNRFLRTLVRCGVIAQSTLRLSPQRLLPAAGAKCEQETAAAKATGATETAEATATAQV